MLYLCVILCIIFIVGVRYSDGIYTERQYKGGLWCGAM